MTAIRFPEVAGRDIDGNDFVVPMDFSGDLNLVLMAFTREHRYDVNTWLPHARELESSRPGFRVYEVPNLWKMNWFQRQQLDFWMSAGIQALDAGHHHHPVHRPPGHAVGSRNPGLRHHPSAAGGSQRPSGMAQRRHLLPSQVQGSDGNAHPCRLDEIGLNFGRQARHFLTTGAPNPDSGPTVQTDPETGRRPAATRQWQRTIQHSTPTHKSLRIDNKPPNSFNKHLETSGPIPLAINQTSQTSGS